MVAQATGAAVLAPVPPRSTRIASNSSYRNTAALTQTAELNIVFASDTDDHPSDRLREQSFGDIQAAIFHYFRQPHSRSHPATQSTLHQGLEESTGGDIMGAGDQPIFRCDAHETGKSLLCRKIWLRWHPTQVVMNHVSPG